MISGTKLQKGLSYVLTTVVAAGVFSTLPLLDTSVPATSRGQEPSPLRTAIHFHGVYPRAFDPWPSDRPLPCFESSPDLEEKDANKREGAWSVDAAPWTPNSGPSNVGYLFLKPYKTGSSTSSGVNLRIARNVARRMSSPDGALCSARFDHGPWKDPAATLFGRRDPTQSFLWTIIREPTERAISLFFHMQVSREGVEPTDSNFQHFLLDVNPHMKYDYYLHNLPLQPYHPTEDDPVQVANRILESYDFIGVTERMDESFVVLAMLLHLPLSDVLYLSAKTGGGYDDGGGPYGRCSFIRPSVVSPGMRSFFESDEWQNLVQVDAALHQATNRSLDWTIERLGRSLFEENLAQFRRAQLLAIERCQPVTVFPCDEFGTFHPPETTDCLWKDSGCAMECLDQIASDFDLW